MRQTLKNIFKIVLLCWMAFIKYFIKKYIWFAKIRVDKIVLYFQGRIREEVVYGICMPVPGFSVLFVLVAVSAVVSALVAGTLLYR